MANAAAAQVLELERSLKPDEIETIANFKDLFAQGLTAKDLVLLDVEKLEIECSILNFGADLLRMRTEGEVLLARYAAVNEAIDERIAELGLGRLRR